MADWLPTRDTALLPWAQNFSARISAAPTTYGFTVPEATSLAGYVTAYNSALATALTPATRTRTTVEAKDLAKAQLVAVIRSFSRRLQANPAVTSLQRTDLGLPIYSNSRTPIPAPSTPPTLNLVASGQLTQLVRIADINEPNKRTKPAGVFAAQVYSWVAQMPGQTPPADIELWRCEGVAKRGEFSVDYTQADVGKQAFVAAQWFNSRGEYGPVSATVSAVVTGSLSAAA